MGKPARTVGKPWRLALVVAPYLVGCAVFLAVFTASRDRLPDRLATHFTGSGRADGFTSAGDVLATGLPLLLVPAFLFAVFAYALEVGPTGWRSFTGLAYGVAGFCGALLIATVLANAGSGSAGQVRFSPLELLAALAVAGVLAGVGVLLAGFAAPPITKATVFTGDSGPRLHLRKGESAAWTRSIGSRAIVVLGAGLLVAGVALMFLAGWLGGIALLIPGAVALVFPGARVVVDRYGLTVMPRWLSFPRLRIPLERIESATNRPVDPLREFGGWGYRVRSGRSGIVLRSGDAIVARLTTGSEFVVTVDDAATAAALLNALVVRDRDRADHGG